MAVIILLNDWKRAHAKEDDALTPLWMLPWFMWAAWMEAYFGNR
ncbi:MAG: hypothetical protein P4L10_11155 [Acidobacteriaceae bacterium]|nr:hypothetical protein [Acidobacteriaceae bacterium]